MSERLLPWLVALVLFSCAAILLAGRMARGSDPALGAGSPVAQATPEPRRVLVRRIERRVIITEPRRPAAGGGRGTASASAAPTRQTGAPSPPAAAPAQPAPASAPAPVTRAS